MSATHATSLPLLMRWAMDRAKERQNRPAARWRVPFLSTSEKSLTDILKAEGRTSNAGQDMRLTDVAAWEGSGCGVWESVQEATQAKELADHLNRTSNRFYGHAGVAFLESLTALPHEAKESLEQEARQMMRAFGEDLAPPEAAGQVRTVLGRFELAAFAGELASRWGVTGWQKGEAERALRLVAQRWIAANGTGEGELTRWKDRLREVIGEPSHWVTGDGGENQRDVYGYHAYSDPTFYLTNQGLTKVVGKAAKKEAAPKLHGAGILLESKAFQKKFGEKNIRVFTLNTEALEAED